MTPLTESEGTMASSVETFRAQLGALLTTEDRKMYDAEVKRYGHGNGFRIGLFLQAADDCAELVAAGSSQSDAFRECFTPTRETHRIARKLGLPVDAHRGRWVDA
jgi:hypothetical protein